MKAHLYFIVASSLLFLKQNVIAAASPVDTTAEKSADDNKVAPTAPAASSSSERSLRGSKVKHNDDTPSLMNVEEYNSRGLEDEVRFFILIFKLHVRTCTGAYACKLVNL